VLTTRREYDHERAVFQAVVDYLRTLRIESVDQRQVALASISPGQAELETDIQFPAAVVTSFGGATEDANGLGQAYNGQGERIVHAPSGKYWILVKTAEASISLSVECFANDPIERSLVQQMVQDACNPVDWMAGFRLKIPYYHGVFATFLLTETRKTDSSEDAQRRLFSCTFTIRATIPVLRLMGPFAPLKTRFQLDVEE
jgi:hypothetical protein